LPLAGVGQLKAGELIAQLEAMLGAALREREGFSLPAPRVLIDVAHPHVQLQDALSGVLTAPQSGEGDALLLSLRANALADLKSKTPKAMPDKLIDIWLVSLAAAAMGLPLHCVVVGANAVLRVPPAEREAARAQRRDPRAGTPPRHRCPPMSRCAVCHCPVGSAWRSAR
jgi:exodeoxyribonuclease V gamma subunit